MAESGNVRFDWERLQQELTPGREAGEGEFLPLKADEILKAAKARKKKQKT